MKYHFYLGFLLFALACEKMDPIPPVLPPAEPEPIDTAYGYPPEMLFNCIGFDTVKYSLPAIPGWKRTLIPSNLSTQAYGVPYFLDEMNGFRYRYGIINKTTDGGLTWKEVYNRPNTNFIKTSFSSAQHGVIACADSYSNIDVYFLITYDGGSTWTRSPNFGANFYSVNRIQFVAPDLGFMSSNIFIGDSYSLYKTIDSAKTWTPVLESPNHDSNGFFSFPSRDTGYYAANSQLFRSIDGGQQWASSEIPSYGVIDFLSFNDSTSVIYGLSGALITKNSGNRWEQISNRPTSFGRFFADGSAVLFQKIKICFTVGSSAYAFVTTNDFGATWKVGPMTQTLVSGDQFCFINEHCIFHLEEGGELYKWTKL